MSYRQTIFAYPGGGGSYIVARENLGIRFGLVAAAALMIDYLLVVAVSVTAGVQELTSAFPVLYDQRVLICVVCIALMVLANLRGMRESGTLFAIPTYAFIATLSILVVVGIGRAVVGTLPAPLPPPQAVEPLSLFLVLRAFAGGCTALTGIEAIANGVPIFRPPEARNAAATLASLAVILGVLVRRCRVSGGTDRRYPVRGKQRHLAAGRGGWRSRAAVFRGAVRHDDHTDTGSQHVLQRLPITGRDYGPRRLHATSVRQSG